MQDFFKKELMDLDDNSQFIWNNNLYNIDKDEYWLLPWEIEANGYEVSIFNMLRKDYNLNFSVFKLDYPGYRKVMVGDGPMLETYQEQYPDVEFVGYKTGKELADYYRQADVFVFPSHWETFGIVMIDAMACGTPVAAYPVQGPLDVIDQNITGCMNDNLIQAINDAILLDRRKVWDGSHRWSWSRAWEIFRDNLIEKSSTRIN